MNSLREMLAKKPWLGWVLAGVFLCAAIAIYLKRTGGEDPYSPSRMQEMVTIKFIDTGDEMEIPRGRLDKELRGRGNLNPEEGVINPKTGKPTGFPFDKDEWSEWIKRINEEKAEASKAAAGKSTGPVVRPTPPAPELPPAAPGAPSAPK